MKKLPLILLVSIGSLIALVLMLLSIGTLILTRPGKELSPLAQDWQNRGSYIRWQSILPENQRFGELDVFTIRAGDPANPAILMIHGYPTSSYDWYDLFELLSEDYYVCALDTPGYGLSDKPRDGYVYSIEDDALST